MRRFLTGFSTGLLLAVLAMPAHAGEDEFFGTILGAGTGGYIGNQFGRGAGNVAATGAGIFVGGLVGNQVGRSMDRNALYNDRPPYYAYPAPVYYYTPAYVPNYVAPPAPPPDPPQIYVDDSVGSYCREYSQRVRVASGIQESYGTVCLQADGSWRVVQ